ncbi:MAG: methyltransferase [Erythrobacter sp.]
MSKAPPRIFAPSQTAAKWARSRDRQQNDAAAKYLTETIANDLAERIDFMQFEPARSLIIGDVTSLLPTTLEAFGSKVTVANLGEFQEEAPGTPAAFDCIIHCLGMGMVNDLPGALLHARNSLAEGGLFFAVFPGAGSLPVLRQLALAADGERPAARIHPQVDTRAGTALLERALFKRQVVDSFPVTVRFSSLKRLVEDLRDHGLTSSLASPAPPLTRSGWARAEAAFEALKDEDGKVAETFEILTLTGWR